MTEAEIEQGVRARLARLAPEADLDRLDVSAPIREALDLDSLDFLNFVIGLHEAFGVVVPEVDYPKLATLKGCVEYLARGAQ
jgi:acyl carrier protein